MTVIVLCPLQLGGQIEAELELNVGSQHTRLQKATILVVISCFARARIRGEDALEIGVRMASLSPLIVPMDKCGWNTPSRV
jgi:hypothetical protein